MKIARLLELANPVIKTFYPGLTLECPLQVRRVCEMAFQLSNPLNIRRPKARMPLKPPLPISSPNNLLHELP
jgi:hypothetical protein